MRQWVVFFALFLFDSPTPLTTPRLIYSLSSGAELRRNIYLVTSREKYRNEVCNITPPCCMYPQRHLPSLFYCRRVDTLGLRLGGDHSFTPFYTHCTGAHGINLFIVLLPISRSECDSYQILAAYLHAECNFTHKFPELDSLLPLVELRSA